MNKQDKKIDIEIRIGELQGIISIIETRIKELKPKAFGRVEDYTPIREDITKYEALLRKAELELLELQINNNTTGLI